MNVLLVSQCSKKALVETRRILDQFAERRGDRTWQTAITHQGLLTVRKLLRKTAKRNTAVACHWIKGANQTELLWVVGSLRQFNEQGAVPTNVTRRDILRTQDENQWHTAEAISLLAGIAGLFHDLGKANKLFQAKLLPKAKIFSEPYRHEWISLRLFQAFVGEDTDEQWLARLANIRPADEDAVLERLIKDGLEDDVPNPFRCLPSALSKTIGWLIVSHHRLPKAPQDTAAPLNVIDSWMTGLRFGPHWNSPQSLKSDWTLKQVREVWEFPFGTPIRSASWCRKANSLGRRALKHAKLIHTDWMADTFSSHLARLVLMLADHTYSAGAPVLAWQDRKYKGYANTDRKTRALKQKLDEHNIGVGHNAVLLANNLPRLRQTLPAITRHKGFTQRSTSDRYRWQDRAFELAQGVRQRTEEQGFFGVNMASTGCGKTFANGRIMYGLADEKLGCRFSVALGLRTLTLQTGDALRERLSLESDDLAVLIGSRAVQDLHDIAKRGHKDKTDVDSYALAEQAGSESAHALFSEHQYVRYDGSLDDGRLSQWLQVSPTLHRLLSAPVLVSTIDHLIPATEGERGGHQIAPMLRLLTSDLVLDEPDDFDIADLFALSRLVHWAGMLGSRVLLSSATLPPSLIAALFQAYATGRQKYNIACGRPGISPEICCAWFDEQQRVQQSDHAQLESFSNAHAEFVQRRVTALKKQDVRRLARLVMVDHQAGSNIIQAVANTMMTAMYELHAEHNEVQPVTGQRVSLGLVRMANINAMVAVARHVLTQQARAGHHIHFCIYHSQYPLLIRSAMERELDTLLSRHKEGCLWEQGTIQQVLNTSDAVDHIFVVFGTSVTEVGRDHDYDWAVAEPSSVRSLIQLAGRIRRHRDSLPSAPNLAILNKNIKALQGRKEAYSKPGYESDDFYLNDKDLQIALEPEQYSNINAIPRIQERAALDHSVNLADLEHAHMRALLFGSEQIALHASLWWHHDVSWTSELQARTPFRKFTGEEDTYVLYMEDDEDLPTLHLLTDAGELIPAQEANFEMTDLPLGEGVSAWVNNDAQQLFQEIADLQDKDLAVVSRQFGEIRLRKIDKKWLYQPLLGAYQNED